MADQGIKLSLPGVDVKDAADYQLIFNSSWPTVKLFKNLRITQINDFSTTNKLYKHGLGYVPAVIPFGGAGGVNTDDTTAEISRQNIFVDNQYLYIAGGGSVVRTLTEGLMILDIDIEKPYKAPIIKEGSSSNIGTSKNYGIKLTQEGKSISSNDLRDYIIHSSARTPLLHAVVPGTLSGTTFSYSHDLAYSPIFFPFFQNSSTNGKYVLLNGYTGLSTSGNTITIRGVAGNKVSLVILKDPFTIDDNIVEFNYG